MALNSKSKGAGGELEAAALLTRWAAEEGFDLTIERNLEQVRHGGADLTGIPNMEVEVKRQEGLDINNWWKQVCKASEHTGKWPLLMYRQNRRKWQFQTFVYAALYDRHGSGTTVRIVALMDETNAKNWFQEFLRKNVEDYQ